MFALIESPTLVMAATGVNYIELGEEKYGLSPLFLDLDSYLEKRKERKSSTFEFEFSDHKATELQYRILESLSEETLKVKAKETRFDGNNYVLSTPNVLSSYLSHEESLFWARKAGWSALEATFLSHGLIFSDNFSALWDRINKRFSYHKKLFPLLASLAERKILIDSAITHGKIKNGSPTDYLEWFAKIRFSAPENLDKLAGDLHGKEELGLAQTLNSSEKNSLLKLVAGMSVAGYRFDSKATRNDATKDIQSDLDRLGIGLDSKTILKWLRKASEVLPK